MHDSIIRLKTAYTTSWLDDPASPLRQLLFYCIKVNWHQSKKQESEDACKFLIGQGVLFGKWTSEWSCATRFRSLQPHSCRGCACTRQYVLILREAMSIFLGLGHKDYLYWGSSRKCPRWTRLVVRKGYLI